MTFINFNKALMQLGMTRPQFAALTQLNPRTVRGYASGERPVPGPVEALLRTWCGIHKAGNWPDISETVFHGVTT